MTGGAAPGAPQPPIAEVAPGSAAETSFVRRARLQVWSATIVLLVFVALGLVMAADGLLVQDVLVAAPIVVCVLVLVHARRSVTRLR